MTQSDITQTEDVPKPLPVPYHPLVILTPAFTRPPSSLAIQILTEQCQNLIADRKTFTITASPVNYAPSKNDFFSLAPNWWQKADGTWEHRDGMKNPISDAATCQKELEQMAMTVHTLAQGHKQLQAVDPALSEACSERADLLLNVFFLDEATRMRPEVNYSQCIPSTEPLKGNANFIIATRYLILVSQALLILPSSLLSRSGIEKWFEAHIQWMMTSSQGQEATQLKNKMSRWYHAALASYLRIRSPGKSVQHATKIIRQLMAEHPKPGETLFVQATSRPRPRHNTLFALEPLFILASLTIPDPLTSPEEDHHADLRIDQAQRLAPAEDILFWLEKVVCIALRTQPSAIEIHIDSDERQEIKIWFFLRQIRRWRAKSVEDVGVDGSPWEGGWRDWSKLAWIMI